jgi:hypothetical protein
MINRQTQQARPRSERIESIIQTLIMLAIGAAAGAASFRHVHDVAAAHGQPGWLAWADAVTLEAASIAAGLDLRRRKRVGKSAAFPATVLTCAVALSLAAQVVEAEPSVIGWLAAALPALGFLAMVKMALGRADSATPWTVPGAPGGVPVSGDQVADTRGPAPDRVGVTLTAQDRNDPVRGMTGTVQDHDGAVRDVTGLAPAARRAAKALAVQGVRLTRTSLSGQLRADGHALSTAAAAELTRILRGEQSTDLTEPGEQSLAVPPSETSTKEAASRERTMQP